MKQKIVLGIALFVGVSMLSLLYIVVMRNVTLVHGEVTVHSAITDQNNAPSIGGQRDVIQVNGYDVKRNNPGKTQLLSTKNKEKRGGLSYAFYARRDDKAQIVLYIQLDQITGELGQTMELHFLTGAPIICRTHWDFNIMFKNKNGANIITITAQGKPRGAVMVHEYPVDQVPPVIEL